MQIVYISWSQKIIRTKTDKKLIAEINNVKKRIWKKKNVESSVYILDIVIVFIINYRHMMAISSIESPHGDYLNLLEWMPKLSKLWYPYPQWEKELLVHRDAFWPIPPKPKPKTS